MCAVLALRAEQCFPALLQLHAAEDSPEEAYGDDDLRLDDESRPHDSDAAGADGGGVPSGSEAPPLTDVRSEPGPAEVQQRRALEVPAGGVFSVILGNRSTHARYFLHTEREATQLLYALTLTPQTPRAAADTQETLATQAAADEDATAATEALPNALDRSTLTEISERVARCWTPAFCLDYDGTLAPMVADPSAARLPPGTLALLKQLSDRHPTAIVSGRSVERLRGWVDVPGLYYAGSHGFEIVGPHGSSLNYTFAGDLLPTIQEALAELQSKLKGVRGVSIEDNKFALSVHTRNVSAADLPVLDALLEEALDDQPLLRRSSGIHVIELRPQVSSDGTQCAVRPTWLATFSSVPPCNRYFGTRGEPLSGFSRIFVSRWACQAQRPNVANGLYLYTWATIRPTRTLSSCCARITTAFPLLCVRKRQPVARPMRSSGCASARWQTSSRYFCTIVYLLPCQMVLLMPVK